MNILILFSKNIFQMELKKSLINLFVSFDVSEEDFHLLTDDSGILFETVFDLIKFNHL